MTERKRRSTEFQLRVAPEAARGTTTLSELSSEYRSPFTRVSE
jgi:hypothetical protein